MKEVEKRAPRNRALTVTANEEPQLVSQIVKPKDYPDMASLENTILNDELQNVISFIGEESISLLILDPPYQTNSEVSLIRRGANDEKILCWHY